MRYFYLDLIKLPLSTEVSLEDIFFRIVGERVGGLLFLTDGIMRFKSSGA